MNNSSSAQAQPVQTPERRSFQIRRPKLQKPRKYQTYEHSSEYPAQVARRSLQMTIDEILDVIDRDMVVTAICDKTGVSLTLSCPDFTVSVVYNDLTGGC